MNHHPKALPLLFLTEMWERFGFYVVQGMIVLYMSKGFGFSDNKSYTISGVFTALAYIAPLLGGLIADRLIGFKTTIFWGGIFLCMGYALLAVWSDGLYIALATIIIGTGLFKPSISSLLGALYPPGDSSARDTGFTIFYIGINFGILLAGLSSGYIKNHFGWHAGFALASIGLIIGLSTFYWGVKKGTIHYQFTQPLSQKKFLQKPWLISYCVLSIIGVSFLLQNSLLEKWLLPIAGIFLICFVFILASRQHGVYKKQIIMLNILTISSVIFWMLYLQMFFSINLFIERLLDKHLLNFTIPTTAFYSLEAIFLVLFAPLFAWLWHVLSLHNFNPTPFAKFIAAILLIAFAFLILGISTYFTNENNLINIIWVFVSYLMIAIGEILLSPIGLAAITALSPPHLTGMMMGIWFAALGFGGAFAGWLAKLASVPDTVQTAALQLPIYRSAFLVYALIAFGVAMGLFLLHHIFKKNHA